jgi:hypothetical protein
MQKLVYYVAFAMLAIFSQRVFAAQSGLDIERIKRSTVYIFQVREQGLQSTPVCVGSGTIVSSDGLILTNAHSVSENGLCQGNALLIALSVSLDAPPVIKFRAEIERTDAGLDLAILRITRHLDGRLIDELSLPFVELGDSSDVALDDTITVVGYPDIGGSPVTDVRGTITGFILEPNNETASWLKTKADIPGVMSGGGAYNQNSQLIGVPITVPLSAETTTSSCLPIQDTNFDGVVNARDLCIPQGASINALRPSNLARSLLRGASLGLELNLVSENGNFSRATGTPEFKRLFFAPSINEAGMPLSVISSLPAGSTSLYLFFDFANMTPETVYELRVSINGIPDPTFSLAPVRWSGGETGMWYIGSTGQPWPNGVHEFTLFANGVASPPQRLIVGEAPSNSPSFSDIVFGLLDARGSPLGNGFVLPTGPTASARFIYRNMSIGTAWTAIWYLDGQEFKRVLNQWDGEAEGTATTSIQADNELPPGSYRLELYIEDRLAATSDFIIAGAQSGPLPQIFTDLHFTSAATDLEAMSALPISNFSKGVSTLYVVFDWERIASGTLWEIRWLVDGEPFFEQTAPWSNTQNGQNYLLRLSNPSGITDGTYNIEILMNKVLLATSQAQVGIGQLPIDQFNQATGVMLRGQILDADTRQGIPGVTLILISKDFSVAEFEWNQDQVYSWTVSDSEGIFELDRPLEFSAAEQSVAYSVIIIAEGYVPVTADGIEVTTDSANPLSITVFLTRD